MGRKPGRKTDEGKKDRYNDPFPTALRYLLETRGITQEQFKDVLGVANRQSVTNYVDGTTSPSIDKVVALAKYFGVTSDYLLGLSETETDNRDLAFVSDYTGLSVEAVEALQKIADSLHYTGSSAEEADAIKEMSRDWGKEKLQIISNFITHYGAYYSGSYFAIKKHSENAMRGIEMMRNWDSFQDSNSPLDVLKAMYDTSKTMQLLLFGYTEMCRAMLNNETGAFDLSNDLEIAIDDFAALISHSGRVENGEHTED